tara:strand:- start:229 stop:663 length:435 start_codon:yes stop_codon:yes gene_type:complete
MKDMTLADILPKKDKPLTSLSLYKYGSWQFILPSNLIATKDNQSFYRMSNVFGLVEHGVLDPTKVSRLGSPGDYVALDLFNNYTIITPAEYQRMFPTINENPPEILNNSDQLKDPKFLTNILKGSASPASNSKTSKPTPPNTGY